MPRKVTLTVWSVFGLAMLGGFITLMLWLLFPTFAGAASSNGNSGYVRRYAANFTGYGFEIFTNLAPQPNGQGGLIIYNKNFFVADDINTLYVRVSGTGDTHGGARLQLSCLVDGQPCNPGAGDPSGGAPTGWLTLSRQDNYNDNSLGPGFVGDGGGGAGDVHDNALMKMWCTPFETKAGTHNVQVRMASNTAPGDPGSAGQLVFMEGVDFTIDGARVADEDDRCENNVIDPSVAVAPSTTTAPDGTIIDTTVFAPLTGLTPADMDPALAQHHADK
jgi:hypothetical protein